MRDIFIGDHDAQMDMGNLENLEKHSDGFFVDYYKGEGDSLRGLF